MSKTRLEAFSDGVIAILITIMVLELKVPHDVTIEALRAQLPTLVCYALSYVFLGIYWNNHHHLLHAADGISGGVMWANLHLLFWLSLVPFATAWMGQTGFASAPTAAYGVVLLCAGLGFTILVRTLVADGRNPRVAAATRGSRKDNLSLGCYAAAIPLAFVNTAISGALYTVVALMWLIPDRRLEGKTNGPA